MRVRTRGWGGSSWDWRTRGEWEYDGHYEDSRWHEEGYWQWCSLCFL